MPASHSIRYALLSAVLLVLLAACGKPSSAPISELGKVASIQVGTPTLVFVYTDG